MSLILFCYFFIRGQINLCHQHRSEMTAKNSTQRKTIQRTRPEWSPEELHITKQKQKKPHQDKQKNYIIQIGLKPFKSRTFNTHTLFKLCHKNSGPQYQRQRLSLKVREPRNLLSQNKNLSMHCIYIFILIISFLYFNIILILDKQKVIKRYSILFFLINKIKFYLYSTNKNNCSWPLCWSKRQRIN